MKKIITTSFFLLMQLILFSNVAQPGIRNAGGNGDFTLLFQQDSAYYKQIQMQKEKISIQLYKGFAVIKGEYWMRNHTNETITINAGYPINANYESHKNGSRLTEIAFDELYQLQVFIDGEKINFQKNETTFSQKKIRSPRYEKPKWYVWKNKFKPNGITKIEVYFIINTNNSSIIEGYDKKYYNAFIYVLETGATWKSPIEEGKIAIQFMDNLSSKKIEGLSSNFNFQHAPLGKIIFTSFQNLTPTHQDNIAITYFNKIENFDFEKIILNSESYFEAIHSFSKTDFQSLDSKPISFDSPFDIPNPGGFIVMGIFFFMLYGIPILTGLFVIYIIYRIIKKIKNKSNETL